MLQRGLLHLSCVTERGVPTAHPAVACAAPCWAEEYRTVYVPFVLQCLCGHTFPFLLS